MQVGWLKTVDQYYYGANNTIQHSNVNSIISATVLALLEDPNRRFIEVEQAFFQRWWSDQTPAKQAAVQGLVASGQLEFINGGWSMHDEACPSFVDMLDNTHLGQRLIFDSFGVVPKTTWQIDPFGHSGFQGSMLSSPLSGVNVSPSKQSRTAPPPTHFNRPFLTGHVCRAYGLPRYPAAQAHQVDGDVLGAVAVHA